MEGPILYRPTVHISPWNLEMKEMNYLFLNHIHNVLFFLIVIRIYKTNEHDLVKCICQIQNF